ncbi:MAG: lipopolysaccharide biosynthesis protein [Methylobacteriaceae bacterium]|nr:lipopolysaccharide biosynthesis protein [Methylobacteriaceae bacterium]
MSVAVTFALNTAFNFVIGLLVAKFLGPAEFGRFALATAIAVFVNSALFDWIRLAATRFYSQRARDEQPATRATLDLVFALVASALGVGALAVILSGVELQLSGALLAMAIAVGVANGLFDYHTALVRARFLDGVYGRLILAKNVAALLFTAGGAWWFQSARMALIGICLSVASSLVAGRAALIDPGATPAAARRDLAGAFARYGLPLVLAGVLYQAIPLLNRSIVAAQWGFAETGQFALAYDIGVRIVAAIGSTLDVLLFQLAVRAEERHGLDRARQQVGRNIGLVLAILAPSCAGVWAILPSFEALVVPAEFRGPFAAYLTLLLPGFFAFAVMQYALSPVFQIGHRTLPVVAAAALACLTNVALVWFAPREAGVAALAASQSLAVCVGLVALLALAALERPVWPRWRDVAGAFGGAALMLAALTPLRALTPGLATGALQIVVGLAVCGAVFALFDVAGLRTLALRRWRAQPA